MSTSDDAGMQAVNAERTQVRRLRQMKSKKVVPQGICDEIQKYNLVVNPDEFIRIVHLSAAQSRFFEQRIDPNALGFRLGIGEPRYDAAGVWKLLGAPTATWLPFLCHRKSSIANFGGMLGQSFWRMIAKCSGKVGLITPGPGERMKLF